MSLRLMLAAMARAKEIVPARHWVFVLFVSSFAACTIPDEPITPEAPVADPGPNPWTAIAVPGIIPPVDDDEDPPPVSWEVDPWADDWTVSAPRYRPGLACEDGIAARISGRGFASWDAAVAASVPYDVIELCPGERALPLAIPHRGPIELRGVSGDPAEVIATVGVNQRWQGLDWARLSGMTIGPQEVTSNDFQMVAARVDLRDVVLQDVLVYAFPSDQARIDRLGCTSVVGCLMVSQPYSQRPAYSVSVRNVTAQITAGFGVRAYLMGIVDATLERIAVDVQGGLGLSVAVGVDGVDGEPDPYYSASQVRIADVDLWSSALAPGQDSSGVDTVLNTKRGTVTCDARMLMERVRIRDMSMRGMRVQYVSVLIPGRDCLLRSAQMTEIRDSVVWNTTAHSGGSALEFNDFTNAHLLNVDLGSGRDDNARDVYNCGGAYGVIPEAWVEPGGGGCLR